MPRNVEIKARARNWDRQLERARRLATEPENVLWQRDTFFHVHHGRLKLREFPEGPCELIHYQRPDQADAKTSEYTICPISDAGTLLTVLAGALGMIGVVAKRRTLILVGQTRVHFDRVEGLGEFLELEVVLRENQSEQAGRAVAQDLMRELEIQDVDLIEGAYLDLLLQEDER